jgi:anti-sigma factor RsiW
MAFTPRSDEQAAQAITRLVDGTLSGAEREEVEAWADSSPEIARQLAAERQISRALATAGPAPPERLVDAVEERFRATGRSPVPRGPRESRPPTALGSRRRPPLTGRWRPALALGTAVAVVLAVVLAVTIGGSTSSPSITAAARLADVPATGPPPSATSPRYLDASYGGVTFPNYARLRAAPTGKLVGRIGGRPALTVFYRLPNGARLSYTVFSGRPVRLPSSARLVHYEGVPLYTYRTADGLSVVTLVRNGRTCVLAARTPQTVVLGLAAEPVLAQRV